jgi:hypothetical protein
VIRATARLSADRRRIEVVFPYDREAIRSVKEVPGYSWSQSKRVWTVPLDLTTGRRLREEFGPYLTLADDLRRWGKAERVRLAMLRQLSEASHASLRVVPRVLPELDEKLAARPYQSADIARMAAANALNANEPGTGKTIEVIGAAAEAGLLDKPCLTLGPVASIEDTWARELRDCGYPHQIFAAEERQQRKGWINWAWTIHKDDRTPFWLVVNPDIIRVKPAPDGTSKHEIVARDPLSGAPYVANQWTDRLLDIEWGLVVIDEFHLFGLTNPRSQFGLAARLLKADRLILSSGTPMGGKYKRLWAALNWLYPDRYGGWWKWASTWLVIKDNGFGKVVKDEIQPGREEEFQRAHAHIFLRRSKLADLPGCPPQVHRVVTCPMTKDQEAQYREFEREAEIRISGTRISGHGILAEWSRLRAFANAACRVTTHGRKLAATPDSGKLPRLLDVLAEVGIRRSQPEPRARAIVGTMDRSFARITAAFLEEHGIKTGLLVGGVPVAPITERFRSNDSAPYVIVMTVQKGGVSLNLQEARAAVALDESWNPDDMVQFFDRGDRGSRTTPLLCVTMRTRETIQEYIAEIAGGKEINNKNAYQFLSALRARSSRAGQP